MLMILGIGNHGNEYANTRHNCGFFVVEALAQQWGHDWTTNKKWQTDLIRCRPSTRLQGAAGEQVLLMRPRTYVNATGAAMQAAATFFKIKPQQCLIIVDDIHLKLGDLRYRPRGGSGGHNGLRDIERRFGKDYPRMRMGIGAPNNVGGEGQVQHVLGRFTDAERDDRDGMVSKACQACLGWLADGDDGALSFNGPLRPPAPRPRTSPTIEDPETSDDNSQ